MFVIWTTAGFTCCATCRIAPANSPGDTGAPLAPAAPLAGAAPVGEATGEATAGAAAGAAATGDADVAIATAGGAAAGAVGWAPLPDWQPAPSAAAQARYTTSLLTRATVEPISVS